MKKFIALTAIVLAASTSQANVKCAVTTESTKGSMKFDKSLFYGEVAPSQYILISKDGTRAEPIDMKDLATNPDYLKSIHGQKIAVFTKEENSIKISATLGKVNALGGNMTFFDFTAATAGVPTSETPVLLLTKHLSLACFDLK